MNSLDSLKARLEERLKGSRVLNEVESLSGQAWAGSLWRRIAAVLIDAALVWLAALLAQMGINYLGTIAPCSAGCFTWNAQDCCLGNTTTVVQVLVLALIVWCGGYVSVRCRSGSPGIFQHSALLTVVLLISFGFVFVNTGLTPLGVTVVETVLFLASFYGYKVAVQS